MAGSEQMTKRLFMLWSVWLALVPAAAGADLKAVLESGPDGKLFDTHFTRYNVTQPKWIQHDGASLRFRIPAVKDVPQLGLYTYFAMAGDFEVSVSYEIVSLPTPQSGFGSEIGVAVDAETAKLSIALTRALKTDGGSGLKVTRSKPTSGGEPVFKEAAFQPTKAKRGSLILKREKAELVCLASEKADEEPAEVGRFPFTDTTVRKIRLFADPGGAPNAIDARLFDFKARAEEITGATPERELAGGYGWWLTVGALLAVGVGYLIHRRRRQRAS